MDAQLRKLEDTARRIKAGFKRDPEYDVADVVVELRTLLKSCADADARPPQELAFPVYQAEEWQCRHVFADKLCCTLAQDHPGDHVHQQPGTGWGEGSDVLAWLNGEQRNADRWGYNATGVYRFQLTGPELMRIRHALESGAVPRRAEPPPTGLGFHPGPNPRTSGNRRRRLGRVEPLKET